MLNTAHFIVLILHHCGVLNKPHALTLPPLQGAYQIKFSCSRLDHFLRKKSEKKYRYKCEVSLMWIMWDFCGVFPLLVTSQRELHPSVWAGLEPLSPSDLWHLAFSEIDDPWWPQARVPSLNEVLLWSLINAALCLSAWLPCGFCCCRSHTYGTRCNPCADLDACHSILPMD